MIANAQEQFIIFATMGPWSIASVQKTKQLIRKKTKIKQPLKAAIIQTVAKQNCYW